MVETKHREAELIECMRKIEVDLSRFLQEEEGQFLLNKVKEMYLQPRQAVEALKSKFKDVVEPVLLEKFQGTWVGFLLWDDFNKTFHLLHNYASAKQGYVVRERYEFISSFILSKAFDKRKFAEPLTDILFREHTKKKVLVFSWMRGAAQPPASKEFPEDMEKPVTINFDKLEMNKHIQEQLDTISDFVDENYATPDESTFERLAQQISDLADKVLADAEGQRVLNDAVAEIDRQLHLGSKESASVKSLVETIALCRSLIWNRLFDQKWQYIYYIPAKFLDRSAVSGVVCAFQDPLDVQEYMVLTQIVNRIFSLFHFGLYMQQMNMFALRSAIAAIMSRNKSHIHGSHIEHGLRNKMDTFEEVLRKRLMQDDPFYKLLRDKLTIGEELSQEEAWTRGVQILEVLGRHMVDMDSEEDKIAFLEDHVENLFLLQDIEPFEMEEAK